MYPSRVQSRGGLGSESKVSLGRQCLTVRPPTPWEAVQKGTLLGSTILGSFHSFLSFLSFFFYFVCHGLCSPPHSVFPSVLDSSAAGWLFLKISALLP